MNDQTDVLRRELSSYAASVPTGRFDLAATERVVRHRGRVRAGFAAGTALALVVGAVVGVGAVHGGGPQGIQTAQGAAAQGLPGLVAQGSVTLPSGMTPPQVERDGAAVWAVADDETHQPVVLHGRVGGELVPLDLRSLDVAGSDVTIALSSGRAYIALSSGGTTFGHARVPYLDERDAATGTDEDGWGLDIALDPSRHSLDADGVALVRSDDGATVLAITSDSGGRQTLRTAVLDPAASTGRDLVSNDVTPAVAVPRGQLTVGARTPSFVRLSLVTTDDGAPSHAYFTGTYDTVPVLDLRTGDVATYRSGSVLPEGGGGLDAAAIGVSDGRIVYEVEGDDHDVHAQVAAPGSLVPAETGPGGGGVYVAAGRVFRVRDTGRGAEVQELSAGALRPEGSTAFLTDSGYLTSHGPDDVEAVGGFQRIAFYAAP